MAARENRGQQDGAELLIEEGSPAYPGSEPRAFYCGERIFVRLTLRYPQAIVARERAPSADDSDAPVPSLRLVGSDRFWGEAVAMGLSRRSLVGWQAVEVPVPWRSMIMPVHSAQPSQLNGTEGVLGSRDWEMLLAVPPSVAAGLAPGEYALRAAFDNEDMPGEGLHRVRLEANPFEFSVREPADDRERGRVLAGQAWYLWDVARDYPAAEEVARRAVELAPDDERTWSALGTACELQGVDKYPEAIAALERSLALRRAHRPNVLSGHTGATIAAMRRTLADRR